eukprot:15366656-Ditylum_brightwellii.AAC.1
MPRSKPKANPPPAKVVIPQESHLPSPMTYQDIDENMLPSMDLHGQKQATAMKTSISSVLGLCIPTKVFLAMIFSVCSSSTLLVEAKLNPTRFNMYNHLTQPTRRDLRDGIKNSHRLRRNLQYIPEYLRADAEEKLFTLATEQQPDTDQENEIQDRNLMPDSSLYDYDAGPLKLFTYYTDSEASTIQNPSPVNKNVTQLPLPFGDGPGVMPGYPEGTREFWEAQPDAYPKQMWEDPTMFLQNPLRCYFGDGTGFLWSFIENAFTGDEIFNIIKSFAAPLGAKIITDMIVPTHLFQPVIESIVEGVSSSVGGIADTADDIIDLIDSLNPFRRKLSESPSLQCDANHWHSCNINNTGCTQCFIERKNSTEKGCSDCHICYRPLYQSKPDMQGVCLALDSALEVTPANKKGQHYVLPVAREFLLNLQQANYIEDKSNDMMKDLRLALFGSGTSDENVKNIVMNECASPSEIECATVDDIKSVFDPYQRALQEDKHTETKMKSLRADDISTGANDDEDTLHEKGPSSGRLRARGLGLSDENVDSILSNLKDLFNSPGLKATKEDIQEKVKKLVSDPKVLKEITKRFEVNMDDSGNNPGVDIATQLLHQTIDKETGKIDTEIFNGLHDTLKEIQRGDTDIFTSVEPTSEGSMRILNEECDYGSGCDQDCIIQQKICELKGFIRCQIQKVIIDVFDEVGEGFDPVKGYFENQGVDIEASLGMVFAFVKELDPFSGGLQQGLDDYPFFKNVELFVDIFQNVVATLVFGCSLGDEECRNQLPSKGQKIITISENSEGKIFMSTGCNSNFEGEMLWYSPIFTIITELLDDVQASILEFINIPVSLVEFLLKATSLLFETMDNVCGYLDAFVQLAEVEAAYENSRYILQETLCREVPTLLPGHGCDGIDSDCNFERDDCGEDAYDPVIDLSRVHEMCGPDKI